MMFFPAILTDSTEVLAQQLAIAGESPAVTTVQIDIIDGLFADNITITPADCANQEFGELLLDFHFMTEEPLDFLYEVKDFKEHLPIRSLIAQVERLSNQADFLHDARAENWKAGFSLDLFTPLSAIDDDTWETVDIIQVMGISAGFQGQPFHHHALETLAEVAHRVATANRPIEIIVDGGVQPDRIPKLEELGATGIVMGSAIWNAPDPNRAVATLASIV